MSSVQVRERAAISPTELVERLAAVAPVTIRKRSKMPSLMRRIPMKVNGPVDAVEFCRALAGRAEATGLLATIVPF